MQNAEKILFWSDNSLKPNSKLPAGYANIAGCASSSANGPYINTGLEVVGKDAKIEGVALISGSQNDWNVIVGAETADNSDDSLKIRRKGPNLEIVANHDDDQMIPVKFNEWFYFSLDKKQFTVDDKTVELAWASEKKCPALCIGAQAFLDSSNAYCKNGIFNGRTWIGAIGQIAIYENSKLLGNFVPARRESDGVIGFFDNVRNIFFASQAGVALTEHKN